MIVYGGLRTIKKMNPALKPGSLNSAQIDDLLKSISASIVKVTATWSGSCMITAPIYKELFSKYCKELKFFTVDVDDNPEIAAKFSIDKLPHFLYFKHGELVDQVIGATPKKILEDKIRKLISGSKIK